MPRVRRAWSAIRPEIRRLIRETDETDPYWTNQLLLDLWNTAMDLRTMDLAEAHEGWVTDEIKTNLVSGQREYTIEEGVDRLKRIVIVRDTGAGSHEQPLHRDEKWSTPVFHSTAGAGDGTNYSYRLQGELIIIEPIPRETITNGLHIEIESAPARFTGDADKIPLRWPGITESLLINDTALLAFRVESAQNQSSADKTQRNHIHATRAELQARWLELIQVRSFGRVFGQPHYLGD
jgi:hypothetical protein